MRVTEAKRTFWQLLELPFSDSLDNPTTILPEHISVYTIWDTFKTFVNIPLENGLEILAFECHYTEPQQLYVSFKRNMITPFDDDPDASYALNFEATAIYILPMPDWYNYIFLEQEINEDTSQAITNFVADVESHTALWKGLSTIIPKEIILFQ